MSSLRHGRLPLMAALMLSALAACGGGDGGFTPVAPEPGRFVVAVHESGLNVFDSATLRWQ